MAFDTQLIGVKPVPVDKLLGHRLRTAQAKPTVIFGRPMSVGVPDNHIGANSSQAQPLGQLCDLLARL